MEKILHTLKESLLEYALRYKIDYLVEKIAGDERVIFGQCHINSIRFELYNMYILVKHKRFDLFESIIEFLTEFHSCFGNILEEKLYFRVLVSLKALFIYDNLRNGDLKKTSKLIKKYFPKEKSMITNSVSSENIKQRKSSLEVQIIKLRSEWNELLLNKNKRETFFKKQFKVQYDENFFNFLILKVNSIFTIINSILPLTQIEEVMNGDFENFNQILFNSHAINFEDEDEIRYDLILDNFKLHKFYLDSITAKENTNHLTKYIKKIFKNMKEWEAELTESGCVGSIITQDNSQSQTESCQMAAVHEFLYLDSQFDDIHINDVMKDSSIEMEFINNNFRPESGEARLETVTKKKAHFKIPNETLDMTKDLTKAASYDSSQVHAFSSFNTAKSNLENNEIIMRGNKLTIKTFKSHKKVISELMTDDDDKDLSVST